MQKHITGENIQAQESNMPVKKKRKKKKMRGNKHLKRIVQFRSN